jgi:glyoxylase-like metal-dependent hydrolase (beta-lactamase superfamily II)/rhodanese-related sulfurtransferase
MEVIQFEDKCLAHFSYALISDGEMAIIDPERNPQPYYDLAKNRGVKIVAVIETHPHADFVSSHAEIHETTGATIYVSRLLGAEYPHQSFDQSNILKIGKASLHGMNTPGHSPDSICILAKNESGDAEVVFTGDTLFIGDCGRPDLRETAGNITSARKDLAKDMYYSLRNNLINLPNSVIVYPAHGAGSLCGKGLSSNSSSTIAIEKASNWSLKDMSEEEFVNELLANQPFVPRYFTNSVEVNKKGASNFNESVSQIPIQDSVPDHLKNCIIIDTRNESAFKKGHLKNAINLMDDTKFETWLGSIVSPGEDFYLLSDDAEKLATLIKRTAKIAYESQIVMGIVTKSFDSLSEPILNAENFKNNTEQFTIVDVRNANEVATQKIFGNAIAIPLPELRERLAEIPSINPIVVHCAAGYRSAAAASIIKNEMNGIVEVYDLGCAINDFK